MGHYQGASILQGNKPVKTFILEGGFMKYKILISTLFIVIAFNHSNAQLIHSYGIKVGMINSGQTWDYTRGSVGYIQPNFY